MPVDPVKPEDPPLPKPDPPIVVPPVDPDPGVKDPDKPEPRPDPPAPVVEPIKKPEVYSDFDPNTLWAVKELKDRVQKRREQVLPDFPPEVYEQAKEPVPKISKINEIGEVSLTFSQSMYFEELFGDFDFTSSSVEVTESDDESIRRLLQDSSAVDLSSLIKTEIRRGDEDSSAPMDKLKYQVLLSDFDESSMNLRFLFDNPLSLSYGVEPDVLVIEFVEPDLFTSKETGKSLPAGTIITKPIPKQFKDESSFSVAVKAGETIEAAA